MEFSPFQLNKLKRLINTSGKSFVFQRKRVDEFGEPTAETVSQSIRGVYHETTSYVSSTGATASTTRTKASPMVLCTWAEASLVQIKDTLNWNGKHYTVSGVKDVAESALIGDISLEEVQ